MLEEKWKVVWGSRRTEEMLLHTEDEKERYIGGTRLGDEDKGEEVVQRIDDQSC